MPYYCIGLMGLPILVLSHIPSLIYIINIPNIIIYLSSANNHNVSMQLDQLLGLYFWNINFEIVASLVFMMSTTTCHYLKFVRFDPVTKQQEQVTFTH